MTTVIADVSYRFNTDQLKAAQRQIEHLDDGMRDFQREVSQSSNRVNRDMREIEKNTDNVSTSINKMKGAIAAVGSVVGGGALTSIVTESINATVAMGNMADVIDMSVESLSTWVYAARSVGVEADQVGDMFKDMREKIGEFVLTGAGPAKEALDLLGISMEDIQSRSFEDQLILIGEGLEYIKDQDQKIFIMETLASDATKLLPLLEDGSRGYRDMARDAKDFNVIVGRDQVEAARKADNEIAKLSNTWDGMIRNLITSGALDSINSSLESFTELLKDPATHRAIEFFGDVLSDAADQFAKDLQRAFNIIVAIQNGWNGISTGVSDLFTSYDTNTPMGKLDQEIYNNQQLLEKAYITGDRRREIEDRIKQLRSDREELQKSITPPPLTIEITKPAGVEPPPWTPSPNSNNDSGSNNKGGLTQRDKLAEELAEKHKRNIDDQIRSEQKLSEALKRIEEDRLREETRLIHAYTFTEEQLINARYERERELMEENVYNAQTLSELKIAIAERESEELKEIEDRRSEEERARAEERVRLIEDSSNTIFDMLSSIRDGAQVNFNNMEGVVEAFFKTNENGNKEWALGTEETLGFIAGATKSMAAEGTAAWKAAAATQATISAYMAINSVLGDPSIPTMARPILAGVIGGLAFANVAKIIASANGNIFDGGSVKAFATGGIVNEPTFFPMKGNQTGLMGEAGPEAIVPLRRGKGGRLGIDATGLNGGGGFSVGGVTVNVHGDAHPEKTREAVIQAMREVARKEIQNQQRTGGSLNPYQFENVVG